MVFPGIPYDAKEIYDQFIYRLGSQEIKAHVKSKHPQTLDQAISLAVKFESFEGSESTLNKPLYVNAIHKGEKPDHDCEPNSVLEIINTHISEGFQKLSESLQSSKSLSKQII